MYSREFLQPASLRNHVYSEYGINLYTQLRGKFSVFGKLMLDLGSFPEDSLKSVKEGIEILWSLVESISWAFALMCNT